MKKKQHINCKLLCQLSVCLAVPAFVYCLGQIKHGDSAFFEYFATHVSPFLASPLLFLNGILPFSLTELALYALVLFSLYSLVQLLLGISLLGMLCFKVEAAFHSDANGNKLLQAFKHYKVSKRLPKLLVIWLCIFAYAYTTFELFHAFNYQREALAPRLQLTVETEINKDDLLFTAERIVKELNNLTAKPSENAEAKLEKTDAEAALTTESTRSERQITFPSTLSALLNLASDAYRQSAVYFPFINGQELYPKPVSLSYYWSYTNTAGMYMPLFKEANVNVNQPAPFVLFSAAHELAHVRNFAREDEANFLAFLTLSMSDSLTAQYAAYLNAWIYVGNDLYKVDKESFNKLYQALPQQAQRDLALHARYWRQFQQRKIAQVSQQINDEFLKYHEQTRGILSYDDVTKLLVALFNKAKTPVA